jgi:hypothetical protein
MVALEIHKYIRKRLSQKGDYAPLYVRQCRQWSRVHSGHHIENEAEASFEVQFVNRHEMPALIKMTHLR